MRDYSASPYFDRYSGDQDHSKKSYTRVLAKPGYVEQASEFNESQSIQRDYLERLGRAFFTDGEVVSGCTLSIENRTTLKISEGSIFIDGLVRHVSATTLTISASGTEKVVAKLVTTIVTSSNDVTLRDPAVGSDNYGMEGADREKQVVVLEIRKSDAVDTTEYHYATVYTLEDGKLPNDSVNSDNNTFSFMTDVLAERTYDENGNYKVYGLDLQPAVEPYNSNKQVKVYISAGRAYIRGYQVTKAAMFEVYLDRATDVRRVTSESHFYSANTRRYKLTHGPVASIVNVTGIKAISREPHNKGIEGGSEVMLKAPVDQIISVWTEIDGVRKEYEYGKDYIQDGDSVSWSPTGDNAEEPERGITYYVNYNYNMSLNIDENFTITSDLDDSYLTFKSGVSLIANSRFYITYDYTLSRRDLVLLDFNGNVSVVKGRPDNYSNLITPYNGSDDFMALGYVNIFPKKAIGSDDLSRIAEIVNYDDCRLTQNNFIAMLKRINALEDSIAQLDMERDLEEGEDTSSLKGYFTDNFESLDKSDLSYNVNNVKYTASVNFVDKELTTQATIYTKDLPKSEISSGSRDYFGDILSSPFTYQEVLRQDFVTGSMLVNPYASYGPLNKVELNPSKDSWVDRSTIKVPNTIENKVYTTESQVLTVWRSSGHRRGAFLGTTENSKTTFTGVTTSKTTSQTVARTAIEFMRVREIAVTGSAFGANTNNISCKFNNNTVALTPTGSTVAGTNTGTVKANANGYFTAKFMVPANTPCGKASVQLISSNGTGTAVYEAVGTLLTTTIYDTTTITSHYTVLNTTTNTYSSDPLAQSFMLSDTYDYNLAKIDIFFKTKDSSRPAILQVRNMVNGYPGETVYSEVKLDPSVVNLPTSGSPNTPVATSIELEQPVYCKAGVYYCFVVLSDSNKYSMFYAEMGKNRLGTSEQLVVNPYGTGVMFSSSNASTWTAHQNSDLKFVLYRTKYTGSGEIIFKDVAIKDIITDIKAATGVALDAAYQVGGDTNDHSSKSRLDWYYRFKTSTSGSSFSEWLPIDTLVYRDFNSLAGTVTLKAVISTDFNTSPFIDMGRVSLRMFLDSTSATYISKSLDDTSFDEPYQALKVSYQAYAPSNTSHDVYYQATEGGTWNKLVVNNDSVPVIGKSNQPRVKLSTVRVDEEFVQYTWEVNRLAGWTDSNGYQGAEYFKLRIDLNVEPAYRYNRPRIRKLNVIFRYNYY